MNERRPLKVKLIGQPQHPMGTLFYVWEQSRTNNPIPDPGLIEQILRCEDMYVPFYTEVGDALLALGAKTYPEKGVEVQLTRQRVRDTIIQIMSEDIPVAEALHFTFAIENMSITLREQMVRHRVGVKVGERIGADIIPDFGSSSWWSQTMRQLPMDRFADEERYIIPDSLDGKFIMSGGETNYSAHELYEGLMKEIQDVYQELIEAGVPLEDARSVIPVGATHAITWTLSLKSLKFIVGKRACWVLQASLWEQMISGMITELLKIDPIFRNIALPPCFKKNGTYGSCPFHAINKERVQGRDNNPPCPLYVYHDTKVAVEASRSALEETGIEPTWAPPEGEHLADAQRVLSCWNSTKPAEMQLMLDSVERFQRLWHLNVYTGEPIDVHQTA